MKLYRIFVVAIILLTITSCFRERTCVCETVEYEDGVEVYRHTMKHTTKGVGGRWCSGMESSMTDGEFEMVTKCDLE
ncbi:MAG: hypothetical protein JJU02_03490 [Cryomorphaceae bacterium]|nr:hypothetical protein [Cryomorphaceae bacterium]